MAPSFEEIIQSPQFTFYVGAEKKPVVVHAAAIAATSDYMNALINGGMSEAEKRCAEFEGVYVEDFLRFCEYAYRGDYTVPQPDIEPTPSEPTTPVDVPDAPPVEEVVEAEDEIFEVEPIAVQEIPDQVVPDNDSWGETWGTVSKKKKKAEGGPAKLRRRLHRRSYAAGTGPAAEIHRGFQTEANAHPEQNFTPVLLAHARLYAFANMRLIHPLRQLTLRKIHSTLLGFKLYERRVGDIIKLARFAYENEDIRGREENGRLDDLRQLVVEYMACEIDSIMKSKEWKELLEDGGEFVGDWWEIAKTYLLVGH